MPFCCFFFHDPASTEIYTLSLHDALPISDAEHLPGAGRRPAAVRNRLAARSRPARAGARRRPGAARQDRKSTRLNSSHGYISYAVFCLKKKTEKDRRQADEGPRHAERDAG